MGIMQKFVLLGLLGLCAWEDMKRKELTVMNLLLFAISGLLLHLFFPICSIYSILWGISLGVAVLGVSFLSRGGIGMGDGILLMVTGVYLGGTANLELFLLGISFSALWAMGLVVIWKKRGKDQMAFAPFLLASYLVMLVRWQI
jgi:leader peptidase (prepilin peptidase)/N-methyltransferase